MTKTDPETLVSFLINAMCLIGKHRILIKGEVEESVKDSLIRFGHRVDADGGLTTRTFGAMKYDRVLALSETFGGGSDAENLAWLRSMRKRIVPGGMLGFQVLDRDRAWSLVHAPGLAGIGLDPEGPAGFDPATGRLSAQILKEKSRDTMAHPGRTRISIRTYNLLEIRSVLNSAGFSLERAYGDWEGANPEEGGARTGSLILVAVKPRWKRHPNFRAQSAPKPQA